MSQIDDMAVCEKIRAACSRVFEESGVDLSRVMFPRLISRAQVRNAIIRQEYADAKRRGETESVKHILSLRWGVSEDHLNRILYNP